MTRLGNVGKLSAFDLCCREDEALNADTRRSGGRQPPLRCGIARNGLPPGSPLEANPQSQSKSQCTRCLILIRSHEKEDRRG